MAKRTTGAPRRCRTAGIAAAVVITACLSSVPRRASADDDDPALRTPVLAPVITLGVAALTVGSYSAVQLLRDRRPSLAWQVVGWVSGIFTATFGPIVGVQAIGADKPGWATLGFAEAAVGTATLALMIHCAIEAYTEHKMTVIPMASSDGLGLSVGASF